MKKNERINTVKRRRKRREAERGHKRKIMN